MKLNKWSDIRHKRTREREAEVARLHDEIKAEQVTLRHLRELLGITQEELAEKMEASQSQLSAFEARSDRRLSNIQKYVEALGGKLRLQAVFKDGKVLEIVAN
jgi:predicted transcriptional regulator